MSTFEAPKALAASSDTKPIGPAPKTNTREPTVTPALLQACTPTESGSKIAPSSKETLSGNL